MTREHGIKENIKYSCERKHLTIDIVNEVGLNKDYVLKLLNELLWVDGLIGCFAGPDDNEDSIEWYVG